MDFPSQYPDSPAKPLVGPARARVLARQTRSSASKPYARTNSNASYHTDTDSPARNPTTPATKSLAPPSAIQPTRSAFSPLRVAASPIALLGSVRKMVSKPLSWLTSAASAVEPDLGIPTSSSTNSLSSIARKRAAMQASSKLDSRDTEYERDAPTRAARAVGERLAAGLLSRSTMHDDEESQLRPPTSNLSSSKSMSRLAPPSLPAPAPAPVPGRVTRRQSATSQASPLAGPSSLPRSAASNDKAMTWTNRSNKRTLNIGSSSFGDFDDSVEVLSDAGPVSPPSARPYNSRSLHTLRSPRSQLLRGSSLRPDDAMSESGSTSLSHSNSFSAFGYGNEVRYADSAFGLPPSSSPFQLSSRRSNRAPFNSGLFTETGTPGRNSQAGSVGLRGASPALSAGHSPARAREGTPGRRNWNGINLAAPSGPSVGDDMMREYLATRTLPGISPVVRRNLGLPVDEPMATSSVAGGSVMDETESLTPSRLGKRDIDMSVDGDSERFGTPTKRRMVWHPELGFISHEELKAREPKLPSPKNEAERLLNVLETLRKPTNTSRGVPLAKGPPTTINVPAPISDLPASAARNTKLQEGKPTVSVAPYTRYMRKAKAAQSNVDEQGGMRARLKKKQPQPSNAMETDDAATEESAALENEAAQEEMEEEEESEEEPAPQPEPVRRSRRLQNQAPAAEKVPETPAKQTDKAPRTSKLKSALKATPLRPTATPSAPVETPKSASHRIPLSAASKPPASTVKKDNFSVKSSTDPTAPRERSSLRQGAAKTSRTHQSSGKFSAWDEHDEEEDLPDASDLAKIKLPTNMFPTGFSFGASAAASSNEKGDDKPTEASSTSSTAGGSLLGRLGGFDSSAPAKEADKAEAPKPATSAPSFSFSAPSKDAPNTKPTFSFGAPKPAETADRKTDASPAPTNSSSPFGGFGAKPAEKKDDAAAAASMPSFFGGAASSSSAGTGGFSFGAPAAASTTGSKRGADDDAEPAAKKSMPSFSFGAPAKPASGGFTFGSATAEKKDEAPKAAAATAGGVPNFFGAKGDTCTAAASSSSTTGAAKPASGGFTFGKPPSASDSTSGSSGGAPSGFSFGAAPKPATDAAKPAAASSTGFTFGSSGSSPAPTSETKPAPAPFTFGAPKPADTASTSAPGSGTMTPTATGGFTFGSSSAADKPTPSTAGFTFGAPASSTGTGFGSTSTATSGTGGFGGFGQPSTPAVTASGAGAGEMMDDSPQKSAPAASTPTFTFGSATPAAAGAKPPSTSFTFGTSTPTSSSAAGAGPASPSTFTFGAAPAAGGGAGGFRFGSPAPAAAPASGGFTFGANTNPTAAGGGSTTPGVGSTPASPFLAPAGVPTTPGGSPFQFGAPAAAAPTSAGGFTFGAAPPTTPGATGAGGFTFGASTTNAAPGFGGFGSTPSAPTTPGGGGFTFGAGAQMPQMPTPQQPGLFSMGAPTAATPGATNSPGGRQIKPLRQRRR